MQIIIDTSDLSELDRSMLAFLADQGEEVEEEPEEEETPEPEPEPKPAKKTSAKKTTKKKAEPEPEPEPEDDGAPDMSDAVAAATQLVSSGESAKVKAALAEVGAKRVSEMSEDDIPAFLAALEA